MGDSQDDVRTARPGAGPGARRGRLLILSAPSGAGKTSLARALIEGDPSTVLSVSHTTRDPRPTERDGRDYHFVTRAQFDRMVAEGRFLEHAEVFDHLYGTSRDAVERELAAGRNVVLDIDWQGARLVRRRIPESVSVFILPPSRAVLEARLRARAQDSEDVIARRMRDAVAEMRHWDEYDEIIVNDDFATALGELRAVVEGRRRRAVPDPAQIRGAIGED